MREEASAVASPVTLHSCSGFADYVLLEQLALLPCMFFSKASMINIRELQKTPATSLSTAATVANGTLKLRIQTTASNDACWQLSLSKVADLGRFLHIAAKPAATELHEMLVLLLDLEKLQHLKEHRYHHR